MKAQEKPWFQIDTVNELDSPCLVIHPDRVLQNIRTAKRMVRDVQAFRPHVKTHKSPEAVRLLLAEGITKFKCATIAEAEMLARSGTPDVFLAYQPVGPKIFRLRELQKGYPSTRFSCMVDNEETARAIAAAFEHEDLSMRVLIDINVGMNRTGILPR